jgi:nucleoside 2-deoxyribosyltransferase
MKRIFLSTTFSGQIDPVTFEVVPDFRTALEMILKALRQQPDVEVFCDVEDSGWKMPATTENGVMKDIAELESADIVVALMQDKPSAGVQFEIGYAVAKGKKVVLALKAGEELSYFNQGLVSGSLVTYVAYDDVKSLVNQLPIAINAPEDQLAGADL